MHSERLGRRHSSNGAMFVCIAKILVSVVAVILYDLVAYVFRDERFTKDVESAV